VSTVALLVRSDLEEASGLATSTATWLRQAGHEARLVRIDPHDRAREDGIELALRDLDLTGADLAVSLGGDGTFLKVVPRTSAAGVPILGVNFGRLGYLLEVEPESLKRALELALAGRLDVEERAALEVRVPGDLAPPRDPERAAPTTTDRCWMALNEMVAEKTVPGHTVRLSTYIDGELFLNYSADGVLVATPTGSTAYNLSAGGPALSPRLRAMIVTPVAPHLSIDRSLVLDAAQVVTVHVRESRPAVLVIDGREVGRLEPGAEITCRVAPEPVRLVSFGERGFAGLLRAALAIDRDG